VTNGRFSPIPRGFSRFQHRTNPYTIWSLNAGWDFDNGVSLFVDARNLTDEAYVPEFGAIVDASAPGTNTSVFYPGEGRAVYGGIAYRF
jgi:iron complex outermembrane receptor protein